jgi:hypothetical protein
MTTSQGWAWWCEDKECGLCAYYSSTDTYTFATKSKRYELSKCESTWHISAKAARYNYLFKGPLMLNIRHFVELDVKAQEDYIQNVLLLG